jgi:hypothetical protein
MYDFYFAFRSRGFGLIEWLEVDDGKGLGIGGGGGFFRCRASSM